MKKTIISSLNKRFDVQDDRGTAETAICQPAKLSMAKEKKGARKKKQLIYRSYQLRSGRSGRRISGRLGRRQKPFVDLMSL